MTPPPAARLAAVLGAPVRWLQRGHQRVRRRYRQRDVPVARAPHGPRQEATGKPRAVESFRHFKRRPKTPNGSVARARGVRRPSSPTSGGWCSRGPRRRPRPSPCSQSWSGYRARLHSCFVPPLSIHSIPDSLTCLVPLFPKRHERDRTLQVGLYGQTCKTCPQASHGRVCHFDAPHYISLVVLHTKI
jgi:hypothetical protein